MPQRLKIADTTIADDHNSIKFEFYGDSVNGKEQAVIETATVDITAFPAPLVNHLACVGFASVAGQKYRRSDTDDAPSAQVVVATLVKAFADGTWTPGRESAPREPTPFVEALSRLTNTPTHVIEHEMSDNKVKWTKSYVAEVRRDPRVAKVVAEIIEARAKRDAAKAKERGKGAAPSLDLGGLFSAPAPAAATLE